MIQGGQRFTREKGMFLPLLGEKGLVVVIGKTITGPALEELLNDTGASVDSNERAVAVPLELFDAAAQQRVNDLSAQKISLYIPGIRS